MQINLKRLAFLALLLPGMATFTALGDENPESRPETETEEATAPKPEARPTQPAGTFTPTEKIKADSSVSFPVDI